MRIFPRIKRPSLKPLRQNRRRMSRHLTLVSVTLGTEGLLYGSALLFALTGGRAVFIDGFGRRGDLVALSLLLVLFAWLHALIKRRLLPRLERYFSPAPYDARRIFFDLGQEARTADSIDHLYESIAYRVGESVETGYFSFFPRQEHSGG